VVFIREIRGKLAESMQRRGPSDFPGPKDDRETAFVMTKSMEGLWGEFDDRFREIVDGLSLAKQIESRYTRAAVSKLCWKFLFGEGEGVIDPELREVDGPFATQVNAAKRTLRQTLLDAEVTSWKVFLGVDGFGELDGNGWEFGGVKFLPSREAKLLLGQELDRAVDPAQRDSRMSIRFIDHALKTQEDSWGKTTVGVVTINACEKGAALHLAERDLQRVLDCINFLASFVGRRGMYAVVLQGTGLRSRSQASVVEHRGSNRMSAHCWPFDIVGDVHPDMLAKQIETGLVGAVDKLLQNTNSGGIENRLLRAIQWEGRSAIEHRAEEAFLWHAVSLEALLLPRNSEGELTYRLSLYVAYVLASDPHRRAEIKKDIREFYNARSQIVHNGHYEIADIEEKKFGRYAKSCILRILWDHSEESLFANKTLDDWLSDKILGVPDVNSGDAVHGG